MTTAVRRLAAVATGLLLAAVLALALAAPALADADLERTLPDDGAVLDQPPPRIELVFSELLDRDRSSIRLVTGGERVASGGVTEDDRRVMAIESLNLGPGEYEVRWTAGSQDGHIVRGRFGFTILAAAATSTPAATSAPTSTAPEPTAGASTGAGAGATEPPIGTAAASAAPLPADATSTAGAGDVILPIVVGLLAVAGAGAYLLRRNRGSA